jgi:hypothetical protein
MRCEHFEREGLARQEAGRPDPHVDQCADCQAARTTYRKMTDAIADVGADLHPRNGWEDAVIAKVKVAAPRRNRWWLGAGAGGVLLAAAVVLLLVNRPPTQAEARIARIRGEAAVRGGNENWTAGDTIDARSPVKNGSVWVYRGDALLFACDRASLAPPTCVEDGAGVRVRQDVLVGTYEVVAFQRAAPSSAPPDLDAARAMLVDLETRHYRRLTISVR